MKPAKLINFSSFNDVKKFELDRAEIEEEAKPGDAIEGVENN